VPSRLKNKAGCVKIDTYYFIRNDETMSDNERSIKIMGTIISFLLVFAPKTLVKRTVAMILLTADVPIPRVVALSGLCERSVRELKRAMAEKDVSSLLTLKNGSGSRSKTKGLEDEIIAEVERGNYHTRQQIADMIEKKFQIKVSVTAVARLLKKTASND
jgi:transposase